MKTGLLFPGQGSQKPQMLHELVGNPAVDETLTEVSDLLGLDVRTLDTAQALQSEVTVQLAILTAGVATASFRNGSKSGPDSLLLGGMQLNNSAL
jgi:malonate decarboxylase epsilon subunit